MLLYAINEPGTELPFKAYDFWHNGITLVSTYGAGPLDLNVTLEMLRSRRVLVDDMITHRLPLAETGLGFHKVAAAQESLKVIIEPGR